MKKDMMPAPEVKPNEMEKPQLHIEELKIDPDICTFQMKIGY